jgi:hypothetical protein
MVFSSIGVLAIEERRRRIAQATADAVGAKSCARGVAFTIGHILVRPTLTNRFGFFFARFPV